MIYEYQEEKFTQLVEALHSLPPEYSKPKYTDFILENTPTHALNQEAEALLWHQRLLHCGHHVFKTYMRRLMVSLTFQNSDLMMKEPSQAGIIDPNKNLQEQLDKIGVEGDPNDTELFPLSGFQPMVEIDIVRTDAQDRFTTHKKYES